MRYWHCLAVLVCLTLGVARGAEVTRVKTPDGGIQPQVAVDSKGTVHLLYFKGDESAGDLFYVKSSDEGATFSKPMRVNSVAGSAMAIGAIRGGQIAVGRNGRVHVAWNGAKPATSRGPAGEQPMCYTRLDDAGTAFEPQRNVIGKHFGLDGGGSIAADANGNVMVAWHAPDAPGRDEGSRFVWLVTSSDDGKTFGTEKAAWDTPTGACGCCGMRIFLDSEGNRFVLYRGAKDVVQRDIYLLGAAKGAAAFEGQKLADWNTGQCVMSLCSIAQAGEKVYVAIEAEKQVYFAAVDRKTLKAGELVQAPGAGDNRKYPAIAASRTGGQVMLAWNENSAWKKGGVLAWQVFDEEGRPVAGAAGRGERQAAWSFPAVFARRDGGFVIVE